MLRESATEDQDQDAFEGLRHDLKNALTAIRGRAGMAERHARRVGSAGPEKDRLLADFAALDDAVREMAERIERLRMDGRPERS